MKKITAADMQLFERIKEACPKKKVISLCNKLMKRKILMTDQAVSELCGLVYWLLVYEQYDAILQCSKLTHDFTYNETQFPFDTLLWFAVYDIWGLEIYIRQRQGDLEEAARLTARMDRQLLTPVGPFETIDSVIEREEKRRARISAEDACCREQIESSNKADANGWRITALQNLIGQGATGLYPNLQEEDEAKAIVQEYLAVLRQVK